MKKSRYLTAREAADALGISPATLYAYVSRGLVRSEAIGGSSRERRYSAEDIQKLKERQQQRKNPAQAVRNALHWGAPLLDSELTLITDRALYYRGQDALRLATTHSLEQVATLFWTGNIQDSESLFAGWPPVGRYLDDLKRFSSELSAMQRLQIALTLAGTDDLAAYDVRPEMVARTGARILRLIAAVLVDRVEANGSISQGLSAGWCKGDIRSTALLNAALILCVDHELNVSSFTARVVASAGTQPYGVVAAGLAALQGPKHGGNTEQVEAMLREIAEPAHAARIIGERLRRGERIPGFGHRLYPEGDPRCLCLLRLIAEAYPDSPELILNNGIIQVVRDTIDQPPNIDFALATLARTLKLPDRSPLSLFALGRTIGWIGHAIEQYQDGGIIRPRATYTGLPPQADEKL